jgi:hypothetical protein
MNISVLAKMVEEKKKLGVRLRVRDEIKNKYER